MPGRDPLFSSLALHFLVLHSYRRTLPFYSSLCILQHYLSGNFCIRIPIIHESYPPTASDPASLLDGACSRQLFLYSVHTLGNRFSRMNLRPVWQCSCFFVDFPELPREPGWVEEWSEVEAFELQERKGREKRRTRFSPGF